MEGRGMRGRGVGRGRGGERGCVEGGRGHKGVDGVGVGVKKGT